MAQYPPPPSQPPYQPPPAPHNQPPLAATTNVTAVVALIISIASWLLCPFLGAIVGGGLGLAAMSEARKRGQAGANMAVASVIISAAHLALYGLILLAVVLIASGTCAALSGSH